MPVPRLNTQDRRMMQQMQHFQEVLLRGMEVIYHSSSAFSHKSQAAVIWLGLGTNPVDGQKAPRVYIAPKKRKTSKGSERGIWVDDLAEIRPGINSDVYLRAPNATTERIANKCYSIIGSEGTLDLEVKSAEARDAVVSRWVLWMQMPAVSSNRT